MTWIMIAFIDITMLTSQTLQPSIETMKLEFASRQACLNAGSGISENLDAVGMCIDKATGDVIVWAPAEDDEDKQNDPTPFMR